MRDLYSVLQVDPKASDAEIKSAFRSRAKTCHPDVRPDDREAEQAFQEAKCAYQYLSNPDSRRIYDAYLAKLRAAERTRRRRAAATMSATFLLTSATVVLVTMWLHQGGALDLARVPTPAAQGQAGIAAPVPAALTGTPARP